MSVIRAKTTRGTANQAGFAPLGALRLSLSLMRILLCVIASSASCSDHQAAQVDDRAAADQVHNRLELPIHLRILRIAATVARSLPRGYRRHTRQDRPNSLRMGTSPQGIEAGPARSRRGAMLRRSRPA